MSTFLTWASVKPSTRKVYMEALREFRDWLDTTSHPLTPSNHRSFDRALTQFAHDTYRSNPKRGARQRVVNARCAVNILYPHTTHNLPSTDRALRGWDNLKPPATKPPVSYGFALLLAHTAMRAGDYEQACFYLIAFDTFCRPREILDLCADDVSLPNGNFPGGLRLRSAKRGRNQSVTIRHPLAAAALQLLISRCAHSSGKLFSIPYHRLCNNLRRDQRKAGMAKADFVTPHCFRHGGASFWNAMAVPIDDIVARGRWASPNSAKTYIQTGSALLFSERLPPAVRELCERLARRPMVLLDHFPNCDRDRLGPLAPPYLLTTFTVDAPGPRERAADLF